METRKLRTATLLAAPALLAACAAATETPPDTQAIQDYVEVGEFWDPHLGFQNEPVGERGYRNGLDIVGRDEVAAVHIGSSSGQLEECE